MPEISKNAFLFELEEELLSFHLPRWLELPEESRLRHATLTYINDALSPILGVHEPLTGTMVQNYIKWGLLPRPENRRYSRKHISRLLVLAILKEVLPIQKIYRGIDLQTRLLSDAEAFDLFGRLLENALRRACRFLEQLNRGQEILELEGLKTGITGATLAFVCESFAFKLIAERLIENKGMTNILAEDRK